MPSESILDGRFYIRHDLSDPGLRNDRFANDHRMQTHLVNQLLTYDRIVIPTNDFGIVPILRKWVGAGPFGEMLESGALRFVRWNSLLGYVGNGKGVSTFQILPGPDKPLP